MRKRSEIKRAEPKLTDLLCAVEMPPVDGMRHLCSEPIYVTTAGHMCKVHGGGGPTWRTDEAAKDKAHKEQTKELADEISKKLKDELNKSERPDVWGSANRPKEKPLREDFGRITEAIFVNDPEAVYKKLEEQLRIGEDRSDRGVLLAAVDNAEANARLAHRLFMTAKLEQQRYELDNAVVWGAARNEAMRVLQHEKDQKLRSKQITEADVEEMAAQIFGDEHVSQEVKRKKAEFMVKSMENLSEMWNKRCSSLESMLGKAR